MNTAHLDQTNSSSNKRKLNLYQKEHKWNFKLKAKDLIKNSNNSIKTWLLLLSGTSTFCLLANLLYYCSRGFDFTDEGFYLTWISNPFIYKWSLTQFGFIYHPLYLLLQGDIPMLRQANVLITFVLAWILTDTLLRLTTENHAIKRWERLVTSAGLATLSSSILFTWLPTPNYNSLTLQALLICGTGIPLAGSTTTPKSIIGWVVIGIGGWLTFMAKPSSAAVLSIITLLYFIASKKINIKLALLSSGTAALLLIISTAIIDGSPALFLKRIQTALTFYAELGGGHTLSEAFRVDRLLLNKREMLIYACTTIYLLYATHPRQLTHLKEKLVSATLLALPALFAVTLALTSQRLTIGLGDFKALLITSVPLAAVLQGLYHQRQEPRTNREQSRWPLALLLAALPYAFAFGTDGNYWIAASSASLFWVLSGLTWSLKSWPSKQPLFLILPMSLTAQALLALLMHLSQQAPYRQPEPLWENKSEIIVGTEHGRLLLSEKYHSYIKHAKTAATEAQFQPGTPMIDLSGHSPGMLYALSATSIGQPWTVGGYPGSLNLAKEALGLVTCSDIAQAWILTEPGASTQIPNELLESLGGDLDKDYELVATWNSENYVASSRVQMLWKPLRSIIEASGACGKARSVGLR